MSRLPTSVSASSGVDNFLKRTRTATQQSFLPEETTDFSETEDFTGDEDLENNGFPTSRSSIRPSSRLTNGRSSSRRSPAPVRSPPPSRLASASRRSPSSSRVRTAPVGSANRARSPSPLRARTSPSGARSPSPSMNGSRPRSDGVVRSPPPSLYQGPLTNGTSRSSSRSSTRPSSRMTDGRRSPSPARDGFRSRSPSGARSLSAARSRSRANQQDVAEILSSRLNNLNNTFREVVANRAIDDQRLQDQVDEFIDLYRQWRNGNSRLDGLM